MTTLSPQDFELARKHSLWMQQFDSKHEFNAIYFTSYELAAFLAERDAETSKRITELENVFAAAKNLCAVKGRYHAEMAMNALMEAITQVELANRNGE